jgi:hypothetical protein
MSPHKQSDHLSYRTARLVDLASAASPPSHSRS